MIDELDSFIVALLDDTSMIDSDDVIAQLIETLSTADIIELHRILNSHDGGVGKIRSAIDYALTANSVRV